MFFSKEAIIIYSQKFSKLYEQRLFFTSFKAFKRHVLQIKYVNVRHKLYLFFTYIRKLNNQLEFISCPIEYNQESKSRGIREYYFFNKISKLYQIVSECVIYSFLFLFLFTIVFQRLCFKCIKVFTNLKVSYRYCILWFCGFMGTNIQITVSNQATKFCGSIFFTAKLVRFIETAKVEKQTALPWSMGLAIDCLYDL